MTEPALSAARIERVRATFALVAADPDGAATAFYARLFAIDPAVRAMFPDDLTDQGRKLMAMLATVVGRLDRLGGLLSQVDALGRRHGGYGVEPHHYASVGMALLATLEQALGVGFCAEARAGWTAAYALLSARMIAAADADAGDQAHDRRGGERFLDEGAAAFVQEPAGLRAQRIARHEGQAA